VQRRACIARAAAAPPTAANDTTKPYSSIALLPEADRAKLAHEWGFDYIGKELPDDVQLKDIIKTLPKEVFEIDNTRGWLTCLTSLITFPLSLYLVHITPAALLPVAWAIAGTAFTGWFVIGHDCGHRSFNTNKV
jgi:acyl-lipid omega-6 desaturase (Delta-12 desaturase)